MRKSVRMQLSFPYDWSNPDIPDQSLIWAVLQRGIFDDVCRICFFYGQERVRDEAQAMLADMRDDPSRLAEAGFAEATLNRMLSNIEMGFRDAELGKTAERNAPALSITPP